MFFEDFGLACPKYRSGDQAGTTMEKERGGIQVWNQSVVLEVGTEVKNTIRALIPMGQRKKLELSWDLPWVIMCAFYIHPIRELSQDLGGAKVWELGILMDQGYNRLI